MDSTAINAIRDLTHAQTINDILEIGSASKQIAIPDGYKLVNLEKFDSSPNRFRGTFATSLMAEFVSYVNETGSSATSVFVDPDNAQAKAIIDLGGDDEPQWGQHKATLKLKKTPAYDKLLQLNNKPLSQQELIDYAEDWEDNLAFGDDDNRLFEFRAAIAAIRRLSVNATQQNESSVGNFNASSSSLDAIEIKAAGATPPAVFNFVCDPYLGFDVRHLICQLRAMTDGKNVTIKYRITAQEQLAENIAQEFKAKLAEAITAEGVRFYTGTMDYQP